MRAKEKILTTLIGTTLLLAILIPVKSNAALQANGSGATKKKIGDWIQQIRKMEILGETLGLDGNASLNNSTGNSNNLDVHMQKNTEYGAMAILSSSNYGKLVPVHAASNGSLKTTTGNKSGVYMDVNTEWVAAFSYQYGVLPKYINKYEKDIQQGKVGDALFETNGWHKTNTSVTTKWFTHLNGPLIRAYTGSIYSYSGYTTTEYNNWGEANARNSYYSRAVVVVGEGF